MHGTGWLKVLQRDEGVSIAGSSATTASATIAPARWPARLQQHSAQLPSQLSFTLPYVTSPAVQVHESMPH